MLRRIESERQCRILYACESGSRAWGFASPDSDYDIRFIYLRPALAYLGTSNRDEVINLPIKDDLDPGGWDVRKAAGLLGKSNGALIEWLHSPVVYQSAPDFLNRWRATASRVYSPRGLANHYRGLAKQITQAKLQDKEVRAKDYLYALRAILASRWILAGRGIPPVAFRDLFLVAPEEVVSVIPGLLEYKEASGEQERMPRIALLDHYVESSMAELAQSVDELSGKEADPAVINGLFRGELEDLETGSTIRIDSGGTMDSAAFTLERVRRPDLLLFETVAGSRAYGTAVEGSDEDRRGVFVAPASFMVGLDHVEQVSDEKGDEVYYELGRFVELLLKNNPNAIELLAMPNDCVLHRHPAFDLLRPELFLSKLCAKTYGEYAMGQIRKARGLNKKIINPEPEERKHLLDFCHVPEGQGSVPVLEWLKSRGLKQERCGLTAVRHMPDLFALYHDPDSALGFRGLVSRKDPDGLVYSSVPKDAQPVAWMHCNRNAFKAHCRAHREYWAWVEKRNEERYLTNQEHGRGYDSKNLMHTLRLLEMAQEIATEGAVQVRRPNREFLLRVRAGEFRYEELVSRAEEKRLEIDEAFARSDLPEQPDRDRVGKLLIQIRESFG